MKPRTLFRILTEDKQRYHIYRILNAQLSGFTAFQARGGYEGQSEPALVIEYQGEPGELGKLRDIAAQIKEVNQQQSVLLQVVPIEAESI